MTTTAPENPAADVLSIPAPENRPGRVTHTTVGKSIGWLFLFLLIFYGVAMVYSIVLGVRFAFAEPGLAAENRAVFTEEATRFIEENILSPTALFRVGLGQFVLLVPLVMWAANHKERSWRESLAIRPVPVKTLGFWMLVYSGYFVSQSLLNMFLQPDFGNVFEQISGSKHFGVFLFIVVLAPVLEELVFRGYLFNAWRHTRAGTWGTILITSGLFALLHGGQYEWLLVGYLFVFGILLGCAREKTDSVMTPVVMHVTNNAISGVAMIYLGVQ